MDNRQLKKLIKRLYKRPNIQQFDGSAFRRTVYPISVTLCSDHSCNAGTGCCHQFRIEGILFCIDYGVDQYGGGNCDYICEELLAGVWKKVPQQRETEVTGRRPGWW